MAKIIDESVSEIHEDSGFSIHSIYAMETLLRGTKSA